MDFLQPQSGQPDLGLNHPLLVTFFSLYSDSSALAPTCWLLSFCCIHLWEESASVFSVASGDIWREKFHPLGLLFSTLTLLCGLALDFLQGVNIAFVPESPKTGHVVFQMKPPKLLSRGQSPLPCTWQLHSYSGHGRPSARRGYAPASCSLSCP